MQLLSLTLNGFRGIRDGLGLDALTLDFEALCGDAELVAIVGANGRGKSTVLDNMHPYLTMPSRAATAGGFSYFDHVFLPESTKELVWALQGRRYRSQVVIRLNGRRRTEAFLFEIAQDGTPRPVELEDGTVSDGKVETYSRCVERLCGDADTFFTSMFGAQGKRQLSDYRNAEIKTLLADLLGLEAIQALGRRAAETARLLKAGMLAKRQETAGMDAEHERLQRVRAAVADAPARAAQAQTTVQQAAAAAGAALQACARLVARREQCRADDARRAQLQAERAAAQAAAREASRSLDDRERAERQRLERARQRNQQLAEQAAKRRVHLCHARAECFELVAQETAVQHAVRRQALAERLLQGREGQVLRCRDRAAASVQAQATLRLLSQRVQGIEREAGQAALQAKALAQRFGLTGEVPCRGSDLQARCKLLGDAHEAQALIPSAHAVLQRLAEERTTVQREAHRVRARAEAQVAVERDVAAAERRLERARRRLALYAQWAARAQEVGAARRRLVEIEDELTGSKALPGSTPSSAGHVERDERDAVAAALRSVAGERTRQAEQLRLTLARLDAVLSAMPTAFDARTLSDAEAARERAVAAHAAAERTHVEALRQAQTLAAMNAELATLAERRAAAARHIERIESAVGDWTLLARGMSNDGLVALAIDDAGPALSALANDLLLACYGPRFTVSILTQTETAKGERREDLDIVVHDAEADESKSVKMMSGGERVWINECLVRAVALYLAQTSDRRHETLCSDEADGALDPARKRMFGAMKREVLRLGGYRREFFISQTPELAGMADAVIDLDRYALPPIGRAQAADATV